MNSKTIFAFLPLLLAACAQAPVAEHEQAVPKAPKATPKPAAEAPKLKLPDIALSDRILFEFMLAEISGQRGNLAVAQEAYTDLAKRTRDPRIVSRALDITLYSGRFQDALDLSQLLLELDPSSLKARQLLASLLIKEGKLPEARPHLEKLLAQEGDNIGQGLLQLARLLSGIPDKEAALSELQELVKPYADQPEAHYAIAQMALEARKLDLAQKELDRAAELRPGWEQAAILEGQMLSISSRSKSLDFYADFLKKYPNSGEVRLSYAKLLVSEKRYSDAKREFEHLRNDFPENEDMQLAVALLSLQLGDVDPAIAGLEHLLAENYRNEDTLHFYLGQAYEQQKNWAAAQKSYLGVRKGEQYIPAQIRYADILAKNGDIKAAREHLHQVRAQSHGERILLIQAEAQILREQKFYREALDSLSKGLKKFPDSPELLYDHAMAAEKLDEMPVLEADLKKLIELEPGNAQAYNALGYSLIEHTDRLEEARGLIEKALSLAPEDPYILDSMGWVYHRMGDENRAVSYLKNALSHHPDPEIAAHLGEALWSAGKTDEAKEVWKSALKDNPANEALLDTMKKFKQ